MLNSPSSSSTSTPRHTIFVGLALIAVMALGAWQIILAALSPGQLDFPRSWLDFREGRTTGGLEKQLDQKLPIRSTLIAAANSTRYLLTGSGGEQVRTGRDDWLFLADELRVDADGAAHLATRVDLLGMASERLSKQGVKLVVALVPDKARVYSSALPWATYPASLESRYVAALSAMRQRGVTVVDLLQPLAAGATHGEVYYRTDTHWNQVGARIAADAVARSVQQAAGDLEKTSFSTTAGSAVTERPGDLIRLMGLENTPNALRPRPDNEATAVTRQTSADAAAGLFGDTAVPVVLTGTSYSLRGNFHGFLQQALSAKVLNAAKDGGGFLQATTAYLTNDAFATNKPKVLLWEVPERFLLAPLDGENAWLAKVGLQR